jgi:hypothetical protein
MLATRLALALQETITQNTDGIFSVPSLFTIYLNPQNLHLWKNQQELLQRLSIVLNEAALEQNVRFVVPPSIHLDEDASLPIDDLKIIVHDLTVNRGETAAIHFNIPENNPGNPLNAFLIFNGSEIFTLNMPVINIGRRSNNQLVIDDPRVSRSHAQLRARRGAFLITDLNSTGGTFVNSERITQQILKPGDVISLAGVLIIYGEEALPPSGKTGKITKKSEESITGDKDK